MFRWLNLLLLFSLIKYSGTPSVGNTPRSVTRKTGGNVTLTCESEAREITAVDLIRLSENILDCEKEECKSKNGRVFKTGSCDVVIKDLIYSDAGKYFLNVYYNNDQTEVKRETLEYHLHIHDEISVQKGEDLKLDVLLINADKVEHQNTISSGWTEVWTRDDGVKSDRMNDSDGNLIINEFTVTDTGTYRVLDSKGEILITVSVTESGSGSKGKLEIDDNKHNEQHMYWFWRVGLPVILLALVCVIVFFIKKHPCLNRVYSPPTDQNAEDPDP